ncbi:MAG TPA: hypothetical protein P5248_06435, partial [Bacteroidales bacterium]|nr:hypothetical protein [Bacteroidales bacterium]
MKHLLIPFFLLIAGATATAQDHSGSYLFGTLTTTSGEQVEGFIRWGKEEVFWSDFLNATKRSNPYYQYLNREDRQYVE